MNSNLHEILKDCSLSQKTEAPLGKSLCHRGNAEQDTEPDPGTPPSRQWGPHCWSKDLGMVPALELLHQTRPALPVMGTSSRVPGQVDLIWNVPSCDQGQMADFPQTLSSALDHGSHNQPEGLPVAGLVSFLCLEKL